MAKKQKMISFDENGTPHERTVTDPENYISGWNMFFETYRVGETNLLPAVLLYYRLLERTPKGTDTVKQWAIKSPASELITQNKNLALLVLDLYGIVESESYKRIYEAYEAGKITPELADILNHQPRFNSEMLNAIMENGGFGEIVLNMAKAGEIDFTPFNHTGDTSPDWFLKYRVSTAPIPGYMGKVSELGKKVAEKETLLNQHKRKIKEALKEHIADALKDGITKDALFEMADEVKAHYKELETADKLESYNPHYPRYMNERTAGFVVDTTEKKIFDLRPHYKEMQELLIPGANPLKEFYYAVRRYTTDALKKQNPATERTPELIFENTPFLMMRNSRESNAIASVSGSMMQIAVQQELALTDNHGNALYNYSANAPMKSGEVIISVKETPKGGVLRPSTEKLHILFDTLFTRSGYREFCFPIDAYMELCKRTPGETTPEARRNFRRKLRQDLQRMKNTKFSANLPGCQPGEIGILNAWLPAPNNCIYIKLESLYCNSLTQKNAGKMQMPQTIFKTNEQNPHLIPIMRALCRNRTDYHNINMEYAKPGSQRAHTISLKTIYEWDLSLPRWAKIKDGDKNKWQFRRLIIDPLFNAIKELNDENYITSTYIDKDGIEHSTLDMKTAGIVDILDPEKWLLRYEVIGFKDDPEMVKSAIERENERKAKQIEETKKKATKRKKQ